MEDTTVWYTRGSRGEQEDNCCVKRDSLWDKFSAENKMDKAACMMCFPNQRTMYGKITHEIRSECATPHRKKWLKNKFGFLYTHIVHHHFSVF